MHCHVTDNVNQLTTYSTHQFCNNVTLPSFFTLVLIINPITILDLILNKVISDRQSVTLWHGLSWKEIKCCRMMYPEPETKMDCVHPLLSVYVWCSVAPPFGDDIVAFTGSIVITMATMDTLEEQWDKDVFLTNLTISRSSMCIYIYIVYCYICSSH